MERAYKRKHIVLQEFEEILSRHNPMQLNLVGNPRAEDEYDSEALSILARFNEELALFQEEALKFECAFNITQATFMMWFGEEIYDASRATMMVNELLETYLNSYPQNEKSTDDGLLSNT